MKAMYALPVVAVLLLGGFSACSQDDDLFEYDLGNDGVSTLAKRSMGRNGETVVPPTPPKEDEEDEPRRILLGSEDFYEMAYIPVIFTTDDGYAHYEDRFVGIGGTVNLYWEEGKNGLVAHYHADIVCDGEGIEGYVNQISTPNKGVVAVDFGVSVENADASSVRLGVTIEVNPEFDYDHAFD